jgi:hypothetical protein
MSYSVFHSAVVNASTSAGTHTSRRSRNGSTQTRTKSLRRAPYFLKVYGLNGPEVRRQCGTCYARRSVSAR